MLDTSISAEKTKTTSPRLVPHEASSLDSYLKHSPGTRGTIWLASSTWLSENRVRLLSDRWPEPDSVEEAGLQSVWRLTADYAWKQDAIWFMSSNPLPTSPTPQKLFRDLRRRGNMYSYRRMNTRKSGSGESLTLMAMQRQGCGPSPPTWVLR